MFSVYRTFINLYYRKKKLKVKSGSLETLQVISWDFRMYNSQKTHAPFYKQETK